MPTNQEWLHKLANESPDELKAWFDAEHNDNLAAEKVVSGDAAHSNDGNAHLKASEDLSDAFGDNLAQLETDVRKQLCDMFGNSQLYESVIEPCIDRAMAMRERDVRNEQKEELEAAHAKNRSLKLHISKMQSGRNGWHVKADNLQKQVDAKNNCIENIMETLHDTQDEVDRLQRRNDELRTSYDKLKRERDNLAADLLACNREREQLRKHLGIALDHAHDICSLVDIDGNVLDVGD